MLYFDKRVGQIESFEACLLFRSRGSRPSCPLTRRGSSRSGTASSRVSYTRNNIQTNEQISHRNELIIIIYTSPQSTLITLSTLICSNRVNRYRGLTKGDSRSLLKIAIFVCYVLYSPQNRHLTPSFNSIVVVNTIRLYLFGKLSSFKSIYCSRFDFLTKIIFPQFLISMVLKGDHPYHFCLTSKIV